MLFQVKVDVYFVWTSFLLYRCPALQLDVQFKVAAVSYLPFNTEESIFPFPRAEAAKEASMSGPLEMGAATMTVTVMVMHRACGQSPSIPL